jgi:CRISPR-associated protein Cmr2
MSFDFYAFMFGKFPPLSNFNNLVRNFFNSEFSVYTSFKITSLYEVDGKIKNRVKKNYVDKIINRKYCEGIKRDYELFQKIFKPNPPDQKILPPFSFFLQIEFFLQKPFISRDDDELYPIDNPVKKDKAFKIPMISASTWKGFLRSVIREENDEEILERLLGPEKEKDELHQGRLTFYPTFFKNIQSEVINPHSREKRAGTFPIYFESVPENEKGTFKILYIPFDLIGQFEKEKKTGEEAFEDLKITIQSVSAMMMKYGFSAKKTSGFGIAKRDPQCELIISGKEEPIPFLLDENFTTKLNEVEKIWLRDGK